ncbi:MAG: Shikimate kinase [Chlamydiales bacterium]|nr:Shikimate kinase [Chlamydiales bacterium]MCH9620011.1 Shikimate kinase [Chlamydiales bacterium]MCH9622885.1 Shikimate kinase [Chlamydiales bacterium]
MKLIFIGFFCAGKSTVGKSFAQRMQLPFVDTDHLIEKRFNKPIWNVFSTLGESSFRELEHEILRSIKEEWAIVSTGGGTPLSKENQHLLKEMGTVVYLKATFPTLYKRIEKRGVPSFIRQEDPLEHCRELFESRDPIYQSICEKVIDAENLEEIYDGQ